MFASSRLSLVIRILVIAAAALFLWALFANDSGASGPAQHYTVRPGDTLWSIAVNHSSGDPREGVWELQHRNRLASAAISPGQVLLIP
jgi:LysM domain